LIARLLLHQPIKLCRLPQSSDHKEFKRPGQVSKSAIGQRLRYT
jgi:hypothetical protein